MEDSLKRLKKGRSAEKPPATHGMTDDDKIRQQLIVDICYYGDQVGHVIRMFKMLYRNTSWQNQQYDLCVQRRLRSAWAFTQSDQSLCCLHEENLGP